MVVHPGPQFHFLATGSIEQGIIDDEDGLTIR